ncbi:MAG TPA: lysophospholipid acyltransferase family protein [Myxococcota bacterium]|nr:lysophospholipid acyltransferase family protein [Myxococcota bacterium]
MTPAATPPQSSSTRAEPPRLARAWRSFLGAVGARLVRVLGTSWRVEVLGENPVGPGKSPVAGALWHRGLFIAAHFFRDQRIVVMVSRSRDGDWIETVLSGLGFAGSPRGSSSRGGASALRRQVELVRAGHSAALLCDGPRGPARVAKAGVVALARAAGVAVQPVGLSARPCLRFGSWDTTLLPLPFARVVVVFGRPVPVQAEMTDEQVEHTRLETEQAVERATREADERLGL